MKRIALRNLPDETQAQGSYADWADIIRQVISRPQDPQKGVDILELRAGVRVLDALGSKRAPEVLELEDADWQHLKDKTLAMPWGMVDRRLLRFVDDVLEATDEPRDDRANGALPKTTLPNPSEGLVTGRPNTTLPNPNVGLRSGFNL